MNVQKQPASEELTAEQSPSNSAMNCLGSLSREDEFTRWHLTFVPVKGNIVTASATATCHVLLLSVFSRSLTWEGREISFVIGSKVRPYLDMIFMPKMGGAREGGGNYK